MARKMEPSPAGRSTRFRMDPRAFEPLQYTYIGADMHARIHTYIHTYRHTYVKPVFDYCRHTYVHTYMRADIHTYTYTYVYNI